MTLKDNDGWPKTRYNSQINNVTTEFFIPALRKSTTYRRIAGFFSSTSLSLAARGIKELVENEGKMQLIVSPILTLEDISVLANGDQLKQEAIIHEALVRQLDLSEEFEKNHVAALGYLLKKGFLEIKVDIPTDFEGNYLSHEDIVQKSIQDEKLGIFQDRDGNVISFRGPVNENRQNWEHGIFEITVDVDWIDGQESHVRDDIGRFEKKWRDVGLVGLPAKTRERLLVAAPDNPNVIYLNKFNVPPWAVLSNGRVLWNHQIRSVNSWMKSKCRGVINMATSGGKTLCALVSASLAPTDSIVVVLVPTRILVDQWKEEILKFDPNTDLIICDSNHPNWNSMLAGKLGPYVWGAPQRNRHLLVLSTIKTAASDKFIRNFDHIQSKYITMISDEVHHLGAPTYSRVFEIDAQRRLGLSATFERDWDEVGTDRLLKYFGEPIDIEYTVADGIREGKLSEYEYHPFFAYLTYEEFDEYREYSKKISAAYAQLSNMAQGTSKIALEKKHRQLLLNRAEIVKKAEDKLRVYGEIVKSSPEKPYIVFADDNDQINRLKTVHKETIRQMNIDRTDNLERDDIMVFSGELGVDEKQMIMEESKENQTPLFAMYCLDEGVDVPEFKSAILVSSSTSKRQYIQRRGRILRASRHKTARLYDIIILPDPSSYRVDAGVADSIIDRERERIDELSRDANNRQDVDGVLDEKLKSLGLA